MTATPQRVDGMRIPAKLIGVGAVRIRPYQQKKGKK